MAKETKVLTHVADGTFTEVQHILIPDLWHVAMEFKTSRNNVDQLTGDAILQVWHNAHAMKRHILEN